jgi:hypothetical protein
MLHSFCDYNYFGDLNDILKIITNNDLLVIISDVSINTNLESIPHIYIPDHLSSLVYIVKGIAVRVLTVDKIIYITSVTNTSISPLLLSALVQGYVDNLHPLNLIDTIKDKKLKLNKKDEELLIEYLEPYSFYNKKSLFSLEDSTPFFSSEFNMTFQSVYALFRLKCLKDDKSVDSKFIKKVSSLKTISSINKIFIEKEFRSDLNEEVEGHSIKFRLMVDVMYQKLMCNKDKFEKLVEEIDLKPLYYINGDDYFGISKNYKGMNELGRVVKICIIKMDL